VDPTEVGTREPPPAIGTQPMNGLNVGARSERPTYVAMNTAERVVVIPGLTGLPSFPKKDTSMGRTLSRASRPATT
jgi:hypothetical protein